MNRLSLEKRAAVLELLVEGSSMRSASRVVGCALNTVTKLLEDVGEACEAYHDEHVRGVQARNIQCDEAWSFCYAKNKTVHRADNGSLPWDAGDVWIWGAVDTDTKLLISWAVGKRDFDTGKVFMEDLRFRVDGRPQITTDGMKVYEDLIDLAFGSDVDYAMLVKQYDARQRYTGAERIVLQGQPDMKRVSTSIVERHNLTIRMSQRRFTRKTNAFSKRIENTGNAMALYSAWYNWCRVHRSIRKTPAMAADLTNEVYDYEWIAELAG